MRFFCVPCFAILAAVAATACVTTNHQTTQYDSRADSHEAQQAWAHLVQQHSPSSYPSEVSSDGDSSRRYDQPWREFLGWDLNPVVNYVKYLESRTPIKRKASPAEAAVRTRKMLAEGFKPEGPGGADALSRALSARQNEAARLLLAAGAPLAWPHREKVSDGVSVLDATVMWPGNARDDKGSLAPEPPDPALLRQVIAANNINTRRSGMSALERACASGLDVGTLKILIKAGANYQTKGNALMRFALQSPRDCDDVVAYLFTLGFSPTDGGIFYNKGTPPLRLAAAGSGKPRCARLLIENGADPALLAAYPFREFGVKAGILDVDGNLLAARGPLLPQDVERIASQKRDILDFARQYPDTALYNPEFYRAASPQDVAACVKDPLRVETSTYKYTRGGSRVGSVGSMGMALFPPAWFSSEFWSHLTGIRRKYTEKTQYSALSIAAFSTAYPEVVDILTSAGLNVTDMDALPLLYAVSNPNSAVLERMLRVSAGSVGKSTMDTLLLLSAGQRPPDFYPATMRLLLEQGADVNAVDKNGATPLTAAVCSKNNDGVALLLGAGADPKLPDAQGRGPLSWASYGKQTELVRILLAAGANPNERDKEGETPLMLAAQHSIESDVTTTRLLLAAGADLSPERADGHSALSIALDAMGYATAELLMDAGAPLRLSNGKTVVEMLPRHSTSRYEELEEMAAKRLVEQR